MKNIMLFALAIIAASSVTGLSGQTIVWNKTWDSGFGDMCGGVALDTVNGAVYTTGISRDGGNMTTDDIVTLKYDTDGNFGWAKVFDSDTTDDAFDVAVDKSGFIYVTGQTWSEPYNRIRLIKYDADGNEIWNVLHDSDREECGYGITTQTTALVEYIYVTGPSWGQAQTVKFSLDGNEVWADAQGYSKYPFDLVAAPNGSIYIACTAMEAANDPFVVRYNSDGDTIWCEFYDLGAEEWISGVAVDKDGYLYLAGNTRVDNDSPSDILVIKLDAEGTLLWDKTYDSDYDDQGNCIAADKDYIYVSGRSYNETSYVTSLPLLCYDKEGNLLWDTLLVSGASGKGIASDGEQNLYISADEGGNFGLIKVHHTTAVKESPSIEPSLTLESLNAIGSSVTLRYSLPPSTSGTLSFYSVDGGLVERFALSQGASTFSWDTHNVPSGVYFARLEAGSGVVTAKTIIVK